MSNSVSKTATYIYLHGFASSPLSSKAQYFRKCFLEKQIDLKIPDLNQDDFSHLTLTRQLQQIETEFQSQSSTPRVLIGSSFGGLTAAWLAQRQFKVNQLILLAPAFGFLSHWLPKLGEEKLKQWKSQGEIPVYHYSEKQYLPLSYQFLQDLSAYDDEELQQPIPTLILHGKQDEVIPIAASQNYAAKRPWVQLIELESDHSLTNVLAEIWQNLQLNLDLF